MNLVKEDILGKVKDFDHIIWDWNGTLLNDSFLVLEVNNWLLREHQLPEINEETYKRLFCHPVEDYYKKIGFDLTRVSFEEIGQKFMKLYAEGLHRVDIFPYAEEILKQIKKLGKKQYILSAAQEQHLHQVTESFGIKSYFEHIFGLGDYLARCKKDRGAELVEHAQINSVKTLMIGDTDHDYEVGKSLGFEVLLVSNGHQCRTRLEKLSAHVI